MKLLIKFTLVLTVLIAVSCNNVLDTEDQTAIDGETLFEEKALAELYLNRIYKQSMPGFGMLNNGSLTDDQTGSGPFNQMTGLMQDPTSTTDLNQTPGNYSFSFYGLMRNVIVFMQGVENSPLPNEEKEELLGQIHFLRAWLYWELVLDYGGVPLVDDILDINDGAEANSIGRSSASECIDFIIADLDQSIDFLAGKSLSYGRITASAAAAFKGRVLLFFASPQFDPNGMSDADGIADRWQAAYEANTEAKNIADSEGHGLYPNFENIFLTEDTEEAIMITKYTTGYAIHEYENSVRPASVKNSNSISGAPTWNLVKAFPMKNGQSITESQEYDSLTYWKDRDPRFYATIGYNGSEWEFDGRASLRQWSYQGNALEQGIIPNTGFYLKKNVNTALDMANTSQTATDWIEIRYAEILLNLAEAANEVGNLGEARDLLIQIRQRAGIEQGTGDYGVSANDKISMRSLIMNERRIEFAFENKRYFDLKRRNLFANGVDGVPGQGLNGKRRTGLYTRLDTTYIYSQVVPTIREVKRWDEELGDSVIIKTKGQVAFELFESTLIDTIDWSNDENLKEYFEISLEYQDNEDSPINFLQPEYNFYYLPINALVRNENLEQTIYWPDGTFDPLQD